MVLLAGVAIDQGAPVRTGRCPASSPRVRHRRGDREPGHDGRGRRLRAASAVCLGPGSAGGNCLPGSAGAMRWYASPPVPGGSPCSDCLPARFSNHAWNSQSHPVGTATSKSERDHDERQRKRPGGVASGIARAAAITPTNAEVAPVSVATAFLLTVCLAGSGGRALVSLAGRSAVRAARSAQVRDVSAWPIRRSNSSLSRRPCTNAALSAPTTCSRSACDARR
jgi:hypothetical protein